MRIIKEAAIFITFCLTSVNLAQTAAEKFTTSINGTIMNQEVNPFAMVSSENGKFWCTYEVIAASDEMRQLGSVKIYKDDILIQTFNDIPGSDVSITNSGILVSYDHSEHFKGILKLHFFSADGSFLFKKEFHGASGFAFSPSGKTAGVRTPEGISVVSLISGKSYIIEKGIQFSFSEEDEVIASAPSGKILVYGNSTLFRTIHTGLELPRKVLISVNNDLTAVIDKYNLKVYSIESGRMLFEDRLGGDLSFRDLKIADGKILAGIHKRNESESAGMLQVYDVTGNKLEQRTGQKKTLLKPQKLNLEMKNGSGYDPIPWPFFPFDSMRTVWNHYEQHMGLGGTDSYMHQGLDLITPIAEPTYSVIDGYVKLVLTIGGPSYWRTAVSDTQSSERSNGWLSAHLIESTIQFDIGDTVQIHDYLGDIVAWTSTWAHIHFVNISDSGTVWYYDDDEWGINFNPILALENYPDSIPPYIDTVFSWSKFAFAINDTSIYLQPDSLFGEIDIIVKVVDYVGDSEWQQPAYTTWYTIKRVTDGEIVKPRTLGHILNHKYPFYGSGWYIDYAGVIYQRDSELPPSGWMSLERNYFHNLTNSNGDSLIELSEKSLALNTADYADGDYRIIVEVFDETGNSDTDSMDVKFKNSPPVGAEEQPAEPYSFGLAQNYPNPFNPETTFWYSVPERAKVIIRIFDILGKEVAVLVNEEKLAGSYKTSWHTKNIPSGVYFYQLNASPDGGQAVNFSETKKMILMK